MMEKSERFILKNADIRLSSGNPYGKGEPLLRSSRASAEFLCSWGA